ncbi:substrate-binding domain-containing protein [Asaia sp. BMEF1]|uniref:PstS family phosphate ABC transporter substrate-binding protein n=1 Tax=Asaia sp. BMEF1 TaxID=3155932 RepID=UPI003F66B3A7
MARFTGSKPLCIPVLEKLWICMRRDMTGAVDRMAANLATSILSNDTPKLLAARLSYLNNLPADTQEISRRSIVAAPVTDVSIDSNFQNARPKTYAVIGSDTLTLLLPALIRGFDDGDADLRFTTDLRGSSLAMPALTAGVTAFAPMGREVWQDDVRAFQQVKGYSPTRIRIAYASYGPRSDGKTPPAFYVNERNPVQKLTMIQVRRIFAAGSPLGNITTWQQAGVHDARLQDKPVHVYGINADSGFSSEMRRSKLEDLPLSPSYREMPNGRSVLQAVARDFFGIGYATWTDPGRTPPGVRLVPLSRDETTNAILPNGHDDRSGWPISYFFNIYVDCPPGERIDPVIKRFLVFCLSDAGQRIIADHRQEEDGYLPLQPVDLDQERQKIDRL